MTIPQPIQNQILALAGEGLSRGLIADRTGISRSTICAWLWRKGIASPKEKPTISRARPHHYRRKVKTAVPRAKSKSAKFTDSKNRTVRNLKPAPTEITCIAVPLVELGAHGCHWPVSGAGRDALFCNASRNGSDHPSYCRHHAARSIKTEIVPTPVTYRRIGAGCWMPSTHRSVELGL